MALAASTSGALWRAFQLACLTLSCVLVALGLVYAEFAAELLPWLYLLDVVAWVSLWHLYGTMPKRALSLALLSAPWELLLASYQLADGALPLFWALRLSRVGQLNVLLMQHEHHQVSGLGALKLVRLVFNIALASHLIACGWLYIGLLNPNLSWISGFLSLDPVSLYIRSIYWTITTMTTVGYGDITPNLNAELLFAAFVMLVGASFYAYVIGNLASVLAQLNGQRVAFQERVQFVSNYLYTQGASEKLINRVHAYYDQRWSRYRHFDEQTVLNDLPAPLAVEVKSELARHLLARVPLFQVVSLPIRDKLLAALKLELVDPGSAITRSGQKPRRIVFVIEGLLQVQFEGETVGQFKPGDYFGNHSLILDEPATADVIAQNYAELMYLSQNDYDEIKELYPEFVEMIAAAMSANSEQMSDLMIRGVVL